MTLSQTHPFITYRFRTEDLDQATWMLLGEAMSKCQHLAGSPLKPDAASRLASVYLARGVQATTAIEGNTLSDEEVEKIVEDGTAGVPESRQYLEREVQNVLAAVRTMDEALRGGERYAIDAGQLRALNLLVLDGIPDKPEVQPGEFRQHDVTVGGYKAPHWTEVPRLVDEFATWLRNIRALQEDAKPEQRFVTAVVAAVLAHLYIAWIHPFGNGNGRTARLVEVQILSESGIVPLVATNLLSDHYNKTRSAYYLALDAAQHSVARFVKYAVQGFTDELREQIDEVRKLSEKIHWESHVYETFRSLPSTEARARQRLLALELPVGRAVTTAETVVLTTELARKYAQNGERTPARDLNDLMKMGLVEKLAGTRKYRARHYVIKAFLPPVAPETVR
ncbi:Fic family protein [Promicromonospora alba]|uniref:Fic family protein n=1 Tax=Promicromonospora alba TaxID=1616110 RepID=A0ABV9HNY2_9MICO